MTERPLSLQYKMFCRMVQHTGVKKVMALPKDELVRRAERMNRKNAFTLPTDGIYDYADAETSVGGRTYHTLRMTQTSRKEGKAILYLYGGGMVLAPSKRYIRLAQQMGLRTNRDIWFPCYPLINHGSITASAEMVVRVYRAMLEEYAPENINIYGFSSGGGLAMMLLGYLNVAKSGDPMPGRMVLVSPGTSTSDPELQRRAEALDSVDIAVPASFMTRWREIFDTCADAPEYMINTLKADMHGWPETWVYYGGNEVLSVLAQPLTERLRAAGVRHSVIVTPRMCHCYCVTSFFPEGAADYNQIIEKLV